LFVDVRAEMDASPFAQLPGIIRSSLRKLVASKSFLLFCSLAPGSRASTNDEMLAENKRIVWRHY